MKMSLAQNKRLNALLTQAGMAGEEEKSALVLYFTANRSTSRKDLEPHQAQALIEHLANAVGAPGYTPPHSMAPAAQPTPTTPRRSRLGAPKAAPDAEAANKMRRKLFAIGRAIGWLTGESRDELAMNRAKLDDFLTRRSYLKKPLAQYTPAELPKLVRQFEQIQKHVEQSTAGRAVADLLSELPAVLPAPRTHSPRKPAA
jgi:hypothetical protein